MRRPLTWPVDTECRSDDLQLEIEVWRAGVSDARRLKELESENAKLRLLADAMLDKAALGIFKQKSLTPAAMEAVAHLQACHGMSERRAPCHRCRSQERALPFEAR